LKDKLLEAQRSLRWKLLFVVFGVLQRKNWKKKIKEMKLKLSRMKEALVFGGLGRWVSG
jgi:hypothetical protein